MLVALSAHCLNKGTFDGAFLHDTWALAQILFGMKLETAWTSPRHFLTVLMTNVTFALYGVCRPRVAHSNQPWFSFSQCKLENESCILIGCYGPSLPALSPYMRSYVSVPSEQSMCFFFADAAL